MFPMDQLVRRDVERPVGSGRRVAKDLVRADLVERAGTAFRERPDLPTRRRDLLVGEADEPQARRHAERRV